MVNIDAIDNVVKRYLVELKNRNVFSVRKSVLTAHLFQIGIRCDDEVIDELLKRKTLISLTNGKVCLNPRAKKRT